VPIFYWRENGLFQIKEAFLTFHYVEKIKSNLIIALNLLDAFASLQNSEVAGAEKVFVAYLNALAGEVNIAANASHVEGFHEVSVKLKEAVKKIEQHDYDGVVKILSETITVITTEGSKAAEVLKEHGLV